MIAEQFFIFRGTENFVSASCACSPVFIFCVSPEVRKTDSATVLGVLGGLERFLQAGKDHENHYPGNVNTYSRIFKEAGGLTKLKALEEYAEGEIKHKASYLMELV